MPGAKRARFAAEYGLKDKTAAVLTDDRALADYFEAVVRQASGVLPLRVANWITGEILRLLNESGHTISDLGISAASLGRLIELVEQGTISGTAGKAVLDEILATGASPDEVVARRDLAQIGDESQLHELIDGVLADNIGMVDEYQAGKTNVVQALVGRVMEASRGKADARKVQEILRRKLDSD
jgi:aspartyl-tRNA(Asn)/glutamyl-tRNA(Gln) amidotransferase subunit B